MEFMEEQYMEWLNHYGWEGFLTVRIPPNVHPTTAYPLLVESALRPLARHLKTRIAAISVVSFGHPGLQKPHFHILLASKSRQLLPNIRDAQLYLSQTKTVLKTHRNAIELLPYYKERHLHYTVEHIVTNSDVNYYDGKLLSSLRSQGAKA